MERNDNDDPTERFLAEIADLRVRRSGRDLWLLRLGGALMPLGIVVGVLAWFTSHNTDNPLDQRDAIILALVGICMSIVGVGLFLRYSLGEFLRFWMARLIHQQSSAALTGGPVEQREASLTDVARSATDRAETS